MYSVTKKIDFCYGHRLLDYDGICKHPHGHNAVAEIEIRTEQLDKRNMVVDFSDIKRIVKGWIDRELDHKMILRHDDPLVKLLQSLGEPMYLLDSNPDRRAHRPADLRHLARAGAAGRPRHRLGDADVVGDLHRLIAFDLDGTLIDSRRDLADSANQLIAELGGSRCPSDAIGRMVGEGAARAREPRARGRRSAATSGRAAAVPRDLRHAPAEPHACRTTACRSASATRATHARLAVLTNKPLAPSQHISRRSGCATCSTT